MSVERFGRRTWRAILVITLALVLSPSPAWAHLVTTGLGPAFDGIGHFFLTLEDVLPVLAITLLAGLRGRESGRRVLFALPSAWVAAGVLGLWLRIPLPQFVSIVSLLACGGLLAANAPLSSRWVTAVAVVLGLAHGMMDGAELAEARLGLAGLMGIGVSLFIVTSLMSALAISLSRPWMRIAVRVAGSWVVATGLLLLGWSVRIRG